MRVSKKKYLEVCLGLMILGVGVNFPGLVGMGDFKGWYVGWLLSVPVLVRHFKIDAALLLLVTAIAIPSALAFWGGAYASPKGVFTAGLFVALVIYARSLVEYLGGEVIMRVYAKWGLVLAFFVLLNEMTYIASPALSVTLFGAGEAVSSFVTRASGLFLEPSDAALYLTPPLIYYFMKGQRRWFLVVLLAMLATFSSLTYAAAVLSILLIVYLRASAVNFAVSALAAGVVIWAAASSPEIMDRAATVASVVGGTELDFYSYNSSVATIVMNSLVARDALLDTHMLGVGFGNFEHAFNAYAPNYFPEAYSGEGLFWNRATGGSLVIRVTAELGAVGVVIVALVLYRLFRAYYVARRLAWRAPGRAEAQSFVIATVVIFVICILRKDSLTNIHLFIFLLGALMLPKDVPAQEQSDVVPGPGGRASPAVEG